MLNKAQDALYWREWNKVKRMFKHIDKSNETEERHQMTLAALGFVKSHLDFTNSEFDKVLAKFRSYTKPDDVGEQMRFATSDRRLLEHKIKVLQQGRLEALFRAQHGEDARSRAEEFIMGIMQDRFGTTEVSRVRHQEPVQPGGEWFDGKSPAHQDKSDLEQLRDTLDARISALRRDRGWTVHELHVSAGQSCPCAPCRKRAAANRSPARWRRQPTKQTVTTEAK